MHVTEIKSPEVVQVSPELPSIFTPAQLLALKNGCGTKMSVSMAGPPAAKISGVTCRQRGDLTIVEQ